MRTTPARIAGSIGVAAFLTLGAVACSSDDSSSGTTGTTEASQMGSGTTMADSNGAMMALTQENMGAGCAAVPTSGPGSFSGMADDPAATAASNNPVLSTLVSAAGAAGLADTLNGPGPFTIFAPTNDAFAKIPANTMSTVMADPSGALTKILTYHVISGDYDAADLVDMKTVETVEGSDVTIALDGSSVEINGQSAVICGNVKVGNGTVHIIDTVLMPPS